MDLLGNTPVHDNCMALLLKVVVVEAVRVMNNGSGVEVLLRLNWKQLLLDELVEVLPVEHQHGAKYRSLNLADSFQRVVRPGLILTSVDSHLRGLERGVGGHRVEEKL